jgi:hypothetical protein
VQRARAIATAHEFQTPRVEPLSDSSQDTVVLRVTVADARRILRALESARVDLSHAPGASHAVGAYRRLAAEVWAQAGRQ